MSRPEPQRTDVRIERYDEDQTEWARKLLDLPPGATLTSADFAAVGVEPYSVTGEGSDSDISGQPTITQIVTLLGTNNP